MPGNLLAAIETPAPLPQTMTAAFGVAIEHRLGHGFGRVRVVHRGRRMGAQVDNVVALPREVRTQLLFQFESGMIGGESDSHGSQDYTGRIPGYVVK